MEPSCTSLDAAASLYVVCITLNFKHYFLSHPCIVHCVIVSNSTLSFLFFSFLHSLSFLFFSFRLLSFVAISLSSWYITQLSSLIAVAPHLFLLLLLISLLSRLSIVECRRIKIRGYSDSVRLLCTLPRNRYFHSLPSLCPARIFRYAGASSTGVCHGQDRQNVRQCFCGKRHLLVLVLCCR